MPPWLRGYLGYKQGLGGLGIEGKALGGRVVALAGMSPSPPPPRRCETARVPLNDYCSWD
jgi:hypothetical protein